MATPTWNQITAPNFSAGNSLIVQAMDQLTKAGEGLQGVAKDYKDTLYKRNLGAIQEYVNSAKTPEELESEGFRTGLARLTGTMAGEYDTLAKAQIVDKAADTLLSRKANQVSVARNEFGLDQDRLTAKKAQNAAELYALRDKPSEFEAAIQRQTAEGALDINAAQSIPLNVLNLGNATIDNRVKRESADSVIASALLDPKAKQANIDTAYGNLEVARKNATANMLQAKAAAARAEEEKNKNKNSYIGTGLAAIDTAKKEVAKQVYGSGLSTDPTKTLKYWKDESTAGLDSFDAAPDYIYEAITKHPELRKLPQNIQQLFAQNTLSGVRDSENFSRPFGAMSGAEKAKVHELLTEEYKNFNQQVKIAEDNATIPIYRKMVFEHAQKTGATGYAAAKDLGLDELTIYKAGISSQLAAAAKIKYASSDKSIPENQFIENEINIATNPDYASLNKPLFPESNAKAIPSETIKFNSPAMQMAGFADYGTAFRFEEREAEKAAQQLKASAKANQAQTGNSLQQTALPPNVNKLISTPLDIVTNPSTIKTKPVADPLRQAALEQPPVATNNTSQPRQLPSAEITQKERMQQTALSNLIGAKLEEKQALVRNAFPNASLTPINKATEPLSSNSIPLIQSMFKLPVTTDTPKVTTIAELDALVTKARKSIPNFDGIAFVQSLDIDPLLKEAYLNRE